MNHIELGNKGEEYAVNHLINKGYTILDTNYRFKYSEIDVVCEKGNELVIVEVKTRKTATIGEPYQAVTFAKQRQIIKVTNHYVIKNRIHKEVRLDVISIVLNRFGMRLEHIENAFQP